MIIRAVDETELEEIAELQRLVFRPDEPDSAQRYLTYTNGDPTYTTAHTRVVFDHGRIVAHLRIWDRILRVRGADLVAAGIGSLCTHPDFRGRGYAQVLMRDSQRYFFEANYDLGLLFSIIGTPFYQGQGWIPIPMPTFAMGKVAAQSRPESVRPLDIGRDLQAVQSLYEAHGLIYESAVVRDPPYWTDGPAQIRELFPTLGAMQEGQLVAYVNFEIDEEGEEVWVKEVCGTGADVYGQLAAAVLAQCDGKKLEGSLPRNHVFVRALEASTGTSATWNTHDEMMVKGVNWPVLREKLGADLVPPGPPTDESEFWRQLLGASPFYSWADIF